MKDYHLIWLSSHPERSEEWLNLLLIEGGDHMKLHGMDLHKMARRASGWRKSRRYRISPEMKKEHDEVMRGLNSPFYDLLSAALFKQS